MNNHSSESSTGVGEENAFAGYSQLGADPTVWYERSGVVVPPPTSEDEEGASPSSSAAVARPPAARSSTSGAQRGAAAFVSTPTVTSAPAANSSHLSDEDLMRMEEDIVAMMRVVDDRVMLFDDLVRRTLETRRSDSTTCDGRVYDGAVSERHDPDRWSAVDSEIQVRRHRHVSISPDVDQVTDYSSFNCRASTSPQLFASTCDYRLQRRLQFGR